MAYKILRCEPYGTYKPKGNDYEFKADGRVSVVYCDPKRVNVQYVAVASSNTDLSKEHAVRAHIEQRKATGLDYAGDLEPG